MIIWNKDMNHNFLRLSGPRNNSGNIDAFFGRKIIRKNNSSLKCLLCHKTFKANESVVSYTLQESVVIKLKTKTNYFHFNCLMETFLEAFTYDQSFTDFFKGFKSGFKLGRDYKKIKTNTKP